MIEIQIITNWLLYIFAVIGLIYNRFSFLVVLITFEVLLLSVNLNFVFGSIYLDDLYGQIVSLFIITMAGTESAIGLSILVTYFHSRGGVSLVKNINLKN